MLVVAAALLDGHGRVCLQQRPRGKHHGGLWEFPGGKVEPGEDPAMALCREIAEELGVGLAPADLVPCGFAASPGLVILLFAARQWTGEVVCLEGEALRWLPPERVPTLAMPPLDYPLADQLIRQFSTGAI
ncbi:MAG: (deoxy)nucleoside triphosphate pyrophosphohydrolase [Sphingomonadales bacterium]|nr:(deoxy)nucleoside triphosphate pyrophosphohydrolase [Sphingomonadales bacterium]